MLQVKQKLKYEVTPSTSIYTFQLLDKHALQRLFESQVQLYHNEHLYTQRHNTVLTLSKHLPNRFDRK